MNIFGNKKSPDEQTIQDVINLMERFLTTVGLDPSKQRIPIPNTVAWTFDRGSATMFVFVKKYGETAWLEIMSPILYIPPKDILPFYRRCLEINHDLTGCALSVHEDVIQVVSGRPTAGLDYIELENMIGFTAKTADDLDNKLAAEFGARLWKRE